MGLFAPDKYFSSVTSIDVEWDLLRVHLDHVLLDIDNTLLRRDNHEVPLAVQQWLAKAGQKGVKLCLLSNNFHDSVFDLARDLDLPIVAKAMKPLPLGYARAMKLIEGSRENTVMVGDQLFTDVVGAHAFGITAYMVCPLVEEDLKHTLMLRRVERVLLGNRVPDEEPRGGIEPVFGIESPQK